MALASWYFFVKWMTKEIYKNIPIYQADNGTDVAFIVYLSLSLVIAILLALLAGAIIGDLPKITFKKQNNG